ncbi:MAG: ABC transporter permease subunit [Gemmataceae bacterium]
MRRFGPGPVFVYECITAARRWQLYAVRAGSVLLLFAAVGFMWAERANTNLGVRLSLRDHAAIGEALFYGFFGMLLALVLLAAPAATAGAVCLDKARGNLLHLFTTDLTNGEVVLGKLASRLLPVFGLLLASIPLLSLCLLMGGIDADAMYTGYAVSAGLAVFGCSVALAFSVWGRKTHEVLIAGYLVEVLLLLAFPLAVGIQNAFKVGRMSDFLAWTNPYLLTFAPYSTRKVTDGTDVALFLAFTFGVATMLTFAAVASVRRVAIRHSSEPQGTKKRRIRRFRLAWLDWLGPQLDWNPVLWREWHRSRPRAWLLVVWGIYYLGCLAGTLAVVILALGPKGGFEPGFGAFTVGLQVSVGLLLASVSAVTALSEERSRGSLDLLMTTTLTTPQIVFGKWLGSYRAIPLLAVLPCVTVLVQACRSLDPVRFLGGPIVAAFVLAAGAAVTSLGLLLATWIARPGRAIAVGVVAYVGVTVGTLVFLTVVRLDHNALQMVGTVSPFYGPGEVSFEAGQPNHDLRGFASVPFWIAFYAAAAAMVYFCVRQTFDYRLGRVTGRARPLRYIHVPTVRAAPAMPSDRQFDPSPVE